jgi:hypothetical protein
MSNSVPGAATTNVVGYFNNQKFPLHLVISRLGITLEVKPGDFIRDIKGRKINDPVFDQYRQLSRETSPTPVPLIAIPVQTPIPVTSDGQSVRQVTEFRMNDRGFREPVMPQPKERAEVPINNPAIRGMSVEEARRLKLIRPVREVPEDYGVNDTDSAMPPRGPDIPVIKEARDMPAPVHKAAQPAMLPPELVEPPVELAGRESLQQQLAESQEQAQALDENPNGFLNAIVPNPPLASAPVVAMPLPQLDDEETTPEPVMETPAPVQLAATKSVPQPLPPRKKFVCAADGRTFDFRSQLEQHVVRKFPHMREQLLAPYPKTD